MTAAVDKRCYWMTKMEAHFLVKGVWRIQSTSSRHQISYLYLKLKKKSVVSAQNCFAFTVFKCNISTILGMAQNIAYYKPLIMLIGQNTSRVTKSDGGYQPIYPARFDIRRPIFRAVQIERKSDLFRSNVLIKSQPIDLHLFELNNAVIIARSKFLLFSRDETR